MVLDPVLAAGGGAELSSDALREVIRVRLLPRTFLVTPNTVEAAAAHGRGDARGGGAGAAGAGRRARAADAAGTRRATRWSNRWFGPDGAGDEWRLAAARRASITAPAAPWPRPARPCIARGLPLGMALRLAQAFTHDALAQARRPGRGQAVPRRVLAPEGAGMKSARAFM